MKKINFIFVLCILFPFSNANADLCAMYKKQLQELTQYTIFMFSPQGQEVCLKRCKLQPVYQSYANLACNHKQIPFGLLEKLTQEKDKPCRETISKIVEIGQRIPSAGFRKINCFYKTTRAPEAP